MTPTELAWAAGLFEGEGHIRISRPNPRQWGSLTVSVTNTDRQVVDYFYERWAGYMKPATGLRPDQHPAWVWVLASRKAAGFLSTIEPFIVRDRVKERIKVALDFQSGKRVTRTPRTYEYAEAQWNAHWYMCALNARGRDAYDLPKSKEFRR